MGQIILLPLRRKAFLHEKNPTASAGFEPANSGTRGQHANPQTTEAVGHDVDWSVKGNAKETPMAFM
jgi:hypothetical protein